MCQRVGPKRRLSLARLFVQTLPLVCLQKRSATLLALSKKFSQCRNPLLKISMNVERVLTTVRKMRSVATKTVRSLASANTVTSAMAECAVRGFFSLVLNVASRFVCLAPNECVLGKHNCDANALCQDAVDGFTCTCRPGFSGDGTLCGTFDFVYPILVL